MQFPTHYIRPAEGLVLKNGAPWLVYGWLTRDGMFTAVDGRKYPADLAVPIDSLGGSSASETASP